MGKLTTLNITERDGDNKISVSIDVNITKDGIFTTTLSKEDVLVIHSYGIELEKNRLGREGFFSSNTLTGIEIDVRKVLRNCLSCEIIEEKPVILYQIETSCTYSINAEGEIVPDPILSWTGLDYDEGEGGCHWIDGTKKLDNVNKSAYGFQVYAKPFLKRLSRYGNGKEKIEYKILEPEKGSYVDWLNSVACISKVCSYKPVKEVDCNERTAKLFVDMIKFICRINEQIKDFLEPDQIKQIAENEGEMLCLHKEKFNLRR